MKLEILIKSNLHTGIISIPKQLRLTPSTQSREMFEVIPFPLEYKLYLFNVTNKDEVMAGGKPNLQEIGPYHFEYVALLY